MEDDEVVLSSCPLRHWEGDEEVFRIGGLMEVARVRYYAIFAEVFFYWQNQVEYYDLVEGHNNYLPAGFFFDLAKAVRGYKIE